MPPPVPRRPGVAPNATVDGDIATQLELVCARLSHDYTRQLLRDVVRLKLEMGFDGDVRDYLARRSGEYPAQKSASDSSFISLLRMHDD